MAIAIGTKTFSNATPNSNQITIAHSQTAGSNRGLLVSFASSSACTVTSMTYGGVPFYVPYFDFTSSGLSQYAAIYYIADTLEGNNNLVINLSSALYTPASIAIYSLTGANGLGAGTFNNILTDPVTLNLNCSAGSLIVARGIASQSAGNPSVTVDGVQYNAVDMDLQHNTNQQTWNELAVNTVGSGNRTVTIDALSGQCVGMAVEIKAFASTPTRRRVIIC